MTIKNPKERRNTINGIGACLNRARSYNDYDITNAHVTISHGNGKLGAVANVSLPPVYTCANCSNCKKYCYAVKAYNRMGDTHNAWTKNLAILKKDPARYFNEISNACFNIRFFRWHVSGDIVDSIYLASMVNVANKNPHCEFLAFTKNYRVVNEYINVAGDLPTNLHVIYSIAPHTPYSNPYNLPECHVNFEDPTKNTFNGCDGTAYNCTGNCEKCIAAGCGCFNLKRGDAVIINQH